MATAKIVTYASSNDDLKFLAGLGVPVEDIANRMGRSKEAVEAMLSEEDPER